MNLVQTNHFLKLTTIIICKLSFNKSYCYRIQSNKMPSSFVFTVIIFIIIEYLSIHIFASHDVKIVNHNIHLSNNNNNNNNYKINNKNNNNNNNNIKINVYSAIDSAANVSSCNSNNSYSDSNNILILNSNCNFRSAWELCHTYNLNIHCEIFFPIKSTILMNMSYGSLILKPGMLFFQ